MSELVVDINDPILASDFMLEMAKQMRAIDTYDTFEGMSDGEVLDPFVLTKERKRSIPVIGDPDEIVIARMQAYYNAISTLIERECGKMAVPLLHLSHEGFGRVLITVGKLVVHDRSLRDVHRFGFKSLSHMKDEADKILSIATTLVGEHDKVAGL
jgi:probable nitrogen fixation protein